MAGLVKFAMSSETLNYDVQHRSHLVPYQVAPSSSVSIESLRGRLKTAFHISSITWTMRLHKCEADMNSAVPYDYSHSTNHKLTFLVQLLLHTRRFLSDHRMTIIG
jgi:hypothetical protein